MKKFICYFLLLCIASSSPTTYASSKVQIKEVEIVPPLPSYDKAEYNQPFKPIERASPPSSSNKDRCCSSTDKTDCCFKQNRKNTIENQHAYIGIATAVLLLVATLGMIFVGRGSH